MKVSSECWFSSRVSTESTVVCAVMDVVSSEARSGLPSELLYADDLVHGTNKVTAWQTCG